MVSGDKKMNKNDHMPDPEKIKEILDVVSEKVPGLLKELSKILYGPDEAKQFGISVATFYKELKDAGMTDEQAFDLTSKYMSTFPPEIIDTTFLSLLVGFGNEIRYANEAAPAASATIFDLSISRNMVLTMDGSSTNTISSTYFFTRSNVKSLGVLIEIPSAIVCPVASFNIFFFFIDSLMVGNADDSTPIILTFG